MAYLVKKTEESLWTLGDTYFSNGKEYFEPLEDFDVEAEALSELHRCHYGIPLVPDDVENEPEVGPSDTDRIKALEDRVAGLEALLSQMGDRLHRNYQRSHGCPG